MKRKLVWVCLLGGGTAMALAFHIQPIDWLGSNRVRLAWAAPAVRGQRSGATQACKASLLIGRWQASALAAWTATNKTARGASCAVCA